MVARVAYIIAAAGDRPRPSMLALYATTGGAGFGIEAWVLARRRRHLAAVPESLGVSSLRWR